MAVYVPGSKGAPSFVRLYQYPNFDGPHAALANKSFFKADKVTMLWNKKGMISIFLPHIFFSSINLEWYYFEYRKKEYQCLFNEILHMLCYIF